MSSALGLIGLTPEEEATLVQLRETEGLQGIHMHEHASFAAEPPKSGESAAAAKAAAPAPEVTAALQTPPADDAAKDTLGAVDAAKDLRIAALETEHGELRRALERHVP